MLPSIDQHTYAGLHTGQVLGPGGAVPGGKITGMPIADLLTAWDLPFASTDPSQGGCPALKPGTKRSAP